MSQIQLPNPDEFARKRWVFTERKTNREIAQVIANLTHGNQATNQRPLNWNEIAEKLQMKQDTVYKFRNLAESLKLLENVNGVWKKPDVAKQQYILSDDLEEFKKIPEIERWWDFMANSGLAVC